VKFVRAIGTDKLLTDALLYELTLRGVDPQKDHIVLLSEWDTLYGRTLPFTFSKILKRALKRALKRGVKRVLARVLKIVRISKLPKKIFTGLATCEVLMVKSHPALALIFPMPLL